MKHFNHKFQTILEQQDTKQYRFTGVTVKPWGTVRQEHLSGDVTAHSVKAALGVLIARFAKQRKFTVPVAVLVKQAAEDRNFKVEELPPLERRAYWWEKD